LPQPTAPLTPEPVPQPVIVPTVPQPVVVPTDPQPVTIPQPYLIPNPESPNSGTPEPIPSPSSIPEPSSVTPIPSTTPEPSVFIFPAPDEPSPAKNDTDTPVIPKGNEATWIGVGVAILVGMIIVIIAILCVNNCPACNKEDEGYMSLSLDVVV